MRLSPGKYKAILGSIGRLVETGRRAIAAGAEEDLGQAMTACHGELQALGVSNPRLDRMVAEALSAGALGAKLSGAGLGGIVIALVRPAQQEGVTAAWKSLHVAWLRSTQVTEQ
jgi:mevalonate kinase